MKWIFIPNDAEAAEIKKACDRCIDNITPLPTIAQKAYVLKCLILAFEDITKSKIVEKWYE